MSFERARRIGAAIALAAVVTGCGPSPGLDAVTPAPVAETSGPGLTDDPIAASFPPESREPSASGDIQASGGAAASDAPILGVVDVARLATGETPEDWVEILSADGACRQAVPPDWFESGIPGQVLSPEVQATAALASDSITGWPAWLQHLQSTYFTDGQEVLVETDRLFLMRATQRGGGSHVLALNGGTTACVIVLAIDAAGVDAYAPIGLQILYSLAEIG